MGKGVGALAKLCQTSGTPCLGLGGIHKKTSHLSSLFTDIYSICPALTTPKSALEKPKKWLRKLARKAGECSSF
jgi:glycerate kinase